MPARFVILHHVLPAGEHWDLMLEHEGVLLTWQLPVQPEGPIALPTTAHRISDHRMAYLDYEGPICDNRGTVTRIDRGGLSILCHSAERIVFEAGGLRFRGRFEIRHIRNDEWALDRLPAPVR